MGVEFRPHNNDYPSMAYLQYENELMIDDVKIKTEDLPKGFPCEAFQPVPAQDKNYEIHVAIKVLPSKILIEPLTIPGRTDIQGAVIFNFQFEENGLPISISDLSGDRYPGDLFPLPESESLKE